MFFDVFPNTIEQFFGNLLFLSDTESLPIPLAEPCGWNYTYLFIGGICALYVTATLGGKLWDKKRRMKKSGKNKAVLSSFSRNRLLFRRIIQLFYSGLSQLRLASRHARVILPVTFGFPKIELGQFEGITPRQSVCRKSPKADVKRAKQNKVRFSLIQTHIESQNVDLKTEMESEKSATHATLPLTNMEQREPSSTESQHPFLTKTHERKLATSTPSTTENRNHKKLANFPSMQTSLTESDTFSTATDGQLSLDKNIHKNIRQDSGNNEKSSAHLHHSSLSSDTQQSSRNIYSKSKTANKRRLGSYDTDYPKQIQRQAVAHTHYTLSAGSECESVTKSTIQNMSDLTDGIISSSRLMDRNDMTLSGSSEYLENTSYTENECTKTSEYLENTSNTENECTKTNTVSSNGITNAFSASESFCTRSGQQNSHNCQVHRNIYRRNVQRYTASSPHRLISNDKPRMYKTWAPRKRPESKDFREVRFMPHKRMAVRNAVATCVNHERPLKHGPDRLKLSSGNGEKNCAKSETIEDTQVSETTCAPNQKIKNTSNLMIFKAHANCMYKTDQICPAFTSRKEETIRMVESLLSLTDGSQHYPSTKYPRGVWGTHAERSRTLTTSLSHGGRASDIFQKSSTLGTSNVHPGTQSRDFLESSSKSRKKAAGMPSHPAKDTEKPGNHEQTSFTTDVSSPIGWDKKSNSLTQVTYTHEQEYKSPVNRAPTSSDPDQYSLIPNTSKSSRRPVPGKIDSLNNTENTTHKLNKGTKLKTHIVTDTDNTYTRRKLKTHIVTDTDNTYTRKIPRCNVTIHEQNRFSKNEESFTDRRQKSKYEGDTHSTSASGTSVNKRSFSNKCLHAPYFGSQEIERLSKKAEVLIPSDNESTCVSSIPYDFRKKEPLLTEKIKKGTFLADNNMNDESAVDSVVPTMLTKNVQNMSRLSTNNMLRMSTNNMLRMSTNNMLRMSTNNMLRMSTKKYNERVTMHNLKCIHKRFAFTSAADKETPVTKEESPVGQHLGQNGDHRIEHVNSRDVYKSSRKLVSISDARRDDHYSLEGDGHSVLDDALKTGIPSNKKQPDTKHSFLPNSPCSDKTITERRSHIPVKRSHKYLKTCNSGDTSRQTCNLGNTCNPGNTFNPGNTSNRGNTSKQTCNPGNRYRQTCNPSDTSRQTCNAGDTFRQTCKVSYPKGRGVYKTESIKKDQIRVLGKTSASSTKAKWASSHQETRKNIGRERRQQEIYLTKGRTHKSQDAQLQKRKARSLIPVRKSIRNTTEPGGKTVHSSDKTAVTDDLKVYHRQISISVTSANEHATIIPPDVVNVKPNILLGNSGFKHKPLTHKVNRTLKNQVTKQHISNENIVNDSRSHPPSKMSDFVKKRNIKSKDILADYLVHTIDHLHKQNATDSEKHVPQKKNVEESPRSSSTDPLVSIKSAASVSSLERPDMLRRHEPSYTFKYKSHDTRCLNHSWYGTNAFRKRLKCLLQYNKSPQKEDKYQNKNVLLTKSRCRRFPGHKDGGLIMERENTIKRKLLNRSEISVNCIKDKCFHQQSAGAGINYKSTDMRSKSGNSTGRKRKCAHPSNFRNDNDDVRDPLDPDLKPMNSIDTFGDAIRNATSERERHKQKDKDVVKPVCLLDTIRTNMNTSVVSLQADGKSLSDVSSRSLITELGRDPRRKKTRQIVEYPPEKRSYAPEKLQSQTISTNEISKNSFSSSITKCKTRSEMASVGLQRAHGQPNNQLVNVLNSWLKRQNADLDKEDETRACCEEQYSVSDSCRYKQSIKHAVKDTETVGVSKWDQLSCNDKGILDMRVDPQHFDLNVGGEELIFANNTIKSGETMTDKVCPSLVIERSERDTSEHLDVTEKNAISSVSAHTSTGHVVKKSVRPSTFSRNKVKCDFVRKHSESLISKGKSDSCRRLDPRNRIVDSTRMTKMASSKYPLKPTLTCSNPAAVDNYNLDSVVKRKATVSSESSFPGHSEGHVKSCPVSKTGHTKGNKKRSLLPAVKKPQLCDLLSKVVNVQDRHAAVISAAETEEHLSKDSYDKSVCTEHLMTSTINENAKNNGLLEQTTDDVELSRRRMSQSLSQATHEAQKHSNAADGSLQVTSISLQISTEKSIAQSSNRKSKTIAVIDADIQEVSPSDNKKRSPNNGYRPRCSARFFMPTVMSTVETVSFDNSYTGHICETDRSSTHKQPAETTRPETPKENLFSSDFTQLQNNGTKENTCSAELILNAPSESLYDTIPPDLQDLEDVPGANGLSVSPRQDHLIHEDITNPALADSHEEGVSEKVSPINLLKTRVGREYRAEGYNGTSSERNHPPNVQLKHLFKEEVSVKSMIDKWTKIQEQNLNKFIVGPGLFTNKGNSKENDCPVACDATIKIADDRGRGAVLSTEDAKINHSLEISGDKMDVLVTNGERYDYFVSRKSVRKPGSPCGNMAESADYRQESDAPVIAAFKDGEASTKTQSVLTDYQDLQTPVNNTAPEDVCVDIQSKLNNVDEMAPEECSGEVILNISSSIICSASKHADSSPTYSHKVSNSKTEHFYLQNGVTENQILPNTSTTESKRYQENSLKRYMENSLTFKKDAVNRKCSRNSRSSFHLLSTRQPQHDAPASEKELHSRNTRRSSWAANSNRNIYDISFEVERDKEAVFVLEKREDLSQTRYPTTSTACQITAGDSGQSNETSSRAGAIPRYKPNEQALTKTSTVSQALSSSGKFTEPEIGCLFQSIFGEMIASNWYKKQTNIKSVNTNELTNGEMKMDRHEMTAEAKTNHYSSKIDKSGIKDDSFIAKHVAWPSLKKQTTSVSSCSYKYGAHKQSKLYVTDKVSSQYKNHLRKIKSPIKTTDFGLKEPETNSSSPVVCLPQDTPVPHKNDNSKPIESYALDLTKLRRVKKQTVNNAEKGYNTKENVSTAERASADNRVIDGFHPLMDATEIIGNNDCTQQQTTTINAVHDDSESGDRKSQKYENLATLSRKHVHNVKYNKHSSKRQTTIEVHQGDDNERNKLKAVDDLESLLNNELGKATTCSRSRQKRDAIFNLPQKVGHRNEKRKKSRRSCSPLSCHLELQYQFLRENDGSVKDTASNTSHQTAVNTSDTTSSKTKRPKKLIKSTGLFKLEEFIQRTEKASTTKCSIPASGTHLSPFNSTISSIENLDQSQLHSHEIDDQGQAGDFRKTNLDNVAKENNVASKRSTSAAFPLLSSEIIKLQHSKSIGRQLDECTIAEDIGTENSDQSLQESNISRTSLLCQTYKSDIQTKPALDIDKEEMDPLNTQSVCEIIKLQEASTGDRMCNGFDVTSISGRCVDNDSANVKGVTTSMKPDRSSLTPPPQQNHAELVDTVHTSENDGCANTVSGSSSSIVLSWFDVDMVDLETMLLNSPDHSDTNLDKLSKTERHSTGHRAHP